MSIYVMFGSTPVFSGVTPVMSGVVLVTFPLIPVISTLSGKCSSVLSYIIFSVF